MIDRPPKRSERTRWPDPAAAGFAFRGSFSSYGHRLLAGALLPRRPTPVGRRRALASVSAAKTFWRRYAASPAAPERGAGPASLRIMAAGSRVAADIRKGRPNGRGARRGEREGKGRDLLAERRRPAKGRNAADQRGKAAARETSGHKKPKTAHCGRIAAARGKSGRAFGGPDARAMQTRTIVPRPRQAALNFGQPRPPRRL